MYTFIHSPTNVIKMAVLILVGPSEYTWHDIIKGFVARAGKEVCERIRSG